MQGRAMRTFYAGLTFLSVVQTFNEIAKVLNTLPPAAIPTEYHWHVDS
jgi:hypothetical protein